MSTRVLTIHRLKCEAPFFDAVEVGRKTAELRLDDRGYQVGDTLDLIRTKGGVETNAPPRRQQVVVTHIVRAADGQWLSPGYVMLSFRTI